MKQPLVSCLCPTYGRPWAREFAIDCFRGQTYPSKELIILDDSPREYKGALRAECIAEPRIVIRDTSERYPDLGAKWEWLIAQARGSILALWPDDDWSHPERLQRQVEHLLRKDAESCALDRIHYYDFLTNLKWVYGVPGRYQDQGLIFTRKYHSAGPPFTGLDSNWMHERPAPAVMDGKDLYIATRHGGNHWGGFYREPAAWNPAEFDLPPEIVALKPPTPATPDLSSITAALKRGEIAEISVSRVNETQFVRPPEDRVSCLMLTYNRPRFAQMAVDCFLGQTYSNRELVIVDDGSVPYYPPSDPRIQYIRLTRQVLVGVKWNLAAHAATGALMCFWADDDWHHPERIARQVAALRQGQGQTPRDFQLSAASALKRIPYVDFRDGKRWMCDPSGVSPTPLDGTYLFTRSFFDLGGFPRSNSAESAAFLWNKPLQAVIDAPELYLGVIHGRNVVSGKTFNAPLWQPDNDPLPLPGAIDDLMQAKEKLVMSDHKCTAYIENVTGEDYEIFHQTLKEGTEEAFLRFAKHCARIYLKPGNHFHGADLQNGDYIVECTFGSFRVLDNDGNVERCDHSVGGAAAMVG